MDIFDDTRNCLVLVKDALDAETPHRGAAERRQQETPHGVSEGVSEAAFERLESEFCDIGIVFALGRFDELRTDKSPEINCGCHFFFSLNVPPRP
jgi:hypothetical protein